MASPKSRTRSFHAQAILGPELHARLPTVKVLLVGAGGIGCELLKNIVLAGFGDITLLDLDTIDLSNLNRQFLFRKKDVKQSKALVAAAAAGVFNPDVRITPVHGNIKEAQFDIDWFARFDIVLNALDNLDARRHVNKMCMAAGIPLVESGTAGYLGQVQPILKDRTECFDCIPKPTPRTFPVCTIRSTPSQPIHCIVWSKSYLMGQLFGEDEDATGELDDAERQGENPDEIATLRKEAKAFSAVRHALRQAGGADAARLVFRKVFDADIRNLLSMGDMWRARAPPVPLDFDAILGGSFVLRGQSAVHGSGSGNGASGSKGSNGSSAGSGLKDQRALSLRDNVELFVSSTNRLAARLQNGEETISFDKDDDDTLDFVTAASNLRSAAYGIEGKTRWEIKEMAGNIIPAIATTNAVVAGVIVLQALHLLRRDYARLRAVHLQFKPAVPLSTIKLSPPSAACGVCRDTYAVVRADPARATLGALVDGVLGARATLGALVDGVLGARARAVGVYEDKRVLADPDWDDNRGRTLASLNVALGQFVTIVDEDDEWGTISVALGALPPDHPADAPPLVFPDALPQPPRKARKATPAATPPPPTPPRASLKRSADADDGDGAPAAKRAKTAWGGAAASPSKRRRLEEDGLVLLEDAHDRLEDDVIVIE